MLPRPDTEGALERSRLVRKKVLRSRRYPPNLVAEIGAGVEQVGSDQRQQRGVAVQPRELAAPELRDVVRQVLRAQVIAAEQDLSTRVVDAPERWFRLTARHDRATRKETAPGASLDAVPRAIPPPGGPLLLPCSQRYRKPEGSAGRAARVRDDRASSGRG